MSTTLIDAITATGDAIGDPIVDHRLEALTRGLADYPEQDVLRALGDCARECRIRLALADVVDRLPPGVRGGLPSNAAWEVAVASEMWDEGRTIVLPRAIMAAFPLAIWRTGDKVGARMAFLSAYPGALREHGAAVQVSLGHDANERDDVVREAVKRGQLSREQALRVLPGLPLPSDVPQLDGPEREPADDSDWQRRRERVADAELRKGALTPEEHALSREPWGPRQGMPPEWRAQCARFGLTWTDRIIETGSAT